MAEINVGGVTFKGGKMLAVLTALSAFVGTMYAGFEFYKDYMDMKEKIISYQAPDLSQVEKEVALAVNRAEEAVEYTRDIKETLRSDLIAVEETNRKLERDVQKSIKDLEKDNREMVRDAQTWFDERTSDIDDKLRQLEERTTLKIKRAVENPLVE
jgi:DNA integrity scanning protein DisA with diadenylate cyclase activity